MRTSARSRCGVALISIILAPFTQLNTHFVYWQILAIDVRGYFRLGGGAVGPLLKNTAPFKRSDISYWDEKMPSLSELEKSSDFDKCIAGFSVQIFHFQDIFQILFSRTEPCANVSFCSKIGLNTGWGLQLFSSPSLCSYYSSVWKTVHKIVIFYKGTMLTFSMSFSNSVLFQWIIFYLSLASLFIANTPDIIQIYMPLDWKAHYRTLPGCRPGGGNTQSPDTIDWTQVYSYWTLTHTQNSYWAFLHTPLME